VKNDVDVFVGEAPQFDDITMLCLKYKAPMQSGEEENK
jgi:sigma-B regulation protein RsbU (phosphoserine phosphatase)